ncbi:MAG: hypothetical protein E6J41_08425 [Chloroflexi bacterium]|nr:MAG: hypothetical protein E6J41_08425 [Chloroflexota bacterium]
MGGGGRGRGDARVRPQRVLSTHRTIFVRATEWRSETGMRIPAEEMSTLLRSLRTRDVCLLNMLGQHHYLTTDLLQSLFFPSLRYTRMRLRWLTESRRLLMRWRQLEPRNQGWRRRYSLFLLAERGAVVLARITRADVRSLVKRSWHAAEYGLQVGHDLDVNAFFVGLASRSRDLADQGLYHWVGQDSLRREYQDEGADLAPDGWGRYLTPDGEVLFHLEWDLGTESYRRLVAKAQTYVNYADVRPGGDLNHVLFVHHASRPAPGAGTPRGHLARAQRQGSTAEAARAAGHPQHRPSGQRQHRQARLVGAPPGSWGGRMTCLRWLTCAGVRLRPPASPARREIPRD